MYEVVEEGGGGGEGQFMLAVQRRYDRLLLKEILYEPG